MNKNDINTAAAYLTDRDFGNDYSTLLDALANTDSLITLANEMLDDIGEREEILPEPIQLALTPTTDADRDEMIRAILMHIAEIPRH